MSTTPEKPRIRHRKRQTAKTLPREKFSKSLREARELISAGDSASGLAALNTLAASTKNPAKRAKILLIIAESETRLSRHTEALAAFEKASQYATQAADPELTLLSGTGIVRSLLRSLRTAEARTSAARLLADLSAAEAAYTEIQSLTPGQLAAQGSITVPARPPGATVALTKIANIFMASGLTEEARGFLLKAIQLSPNGASRARQALAKIALASDQPELAERYAREALLMGRFQAKTVAAWQLYLDARARQNLVPILEADVLASFQQHATGRIAAASALSITRILRAHGDPLWKNIATDSLAKSTDPVIATEIEKIFHADAKLFSTEPPELTAARSLKFLRADDTSAREVIAHAKSYVRFSFQAGHEPDTARVLRIVEKRFPANVAQAVRHTMALGAIMAGKHDLARKWLIDLTTTAAQQNQNEAWGKATWALARMESLLEKNAEAAFWYMEVAAKTATPPRFKIQALLLGLKFLSKSDDHSSDVGKLITAARSILGDVNDFRILLDAGRQLALAGSLFVELKTEVTNRAVKLGTKSIAEATCPRLALLDLEYLSRKLFYDLSRGKIVVEIWNDLSEELKKEFEALSGNTWINFVSTVFLSLAMGHHKEQSLFLEAEIMNSKSHTSEEYAIFGSTVAALRINEENLPEAYRYFDWLVIEAPGLRISHQAHYWIALRTFLRTGSLEKEDINQYLKSISGVPALQIEESTYVKIGILVQLSRINIPMVFLKNISSPTLSFYKDDFETDTFLFRRFYP